MVTELRIYFQGDAQLKPGLHTFLKAIVEHARRKRCRFRLIEAKGAPVQDFQDALKTHPDAWNVLLLDSDAPFYGSHANLCRGKKLDLQHEGSVFWMVPMMESWFFADVPALSAFYGTHFQESVLKGNPRVEEIPQADVLSRLKKATDGEYHKARDAPRLFEWIDPIIVREAAPNCDRMFRLILDRLLAS